MSFLLMKRTFVLRKCLQISIFGGQTNKSNFCSIIVISLLMSPLLGFRPSLWITLKENGHNPPRGPSADWRLVTTANAVGTNSLTCVPKHSLRLKIFGYPSDERRLQTLLNFHVPTTSALTAGSSSSSSF
jgi:hypothetical protein